MSISCIFHVYDIPVVLDAWIKYSMCSSHDSPVLAGLSVIQRMSPYVNGRFIHDNLVVGR